MHEKQEIEQYFFDAETLDHLARFAMSFKNPCCLCTPSLGQELEARGVREVRTLDLDTRFSFLKGFREYDISKPEPLDDDFGIIICDPPFLTVPLPRLFDAVRILSRENFEQPLLVNFLSTRSASITSAFAPFALQPTGYHPTYLTIQNFGRNRMEFFGNLGPSQPLKPPAPTLF